MMKSQHINSPFARALRKQAALLAPRDYEATRAAIRQMGQLAKFDPYGRGVRHVATNRHAAMLASLSA